MTSAPSDRTRQQQCTTRGDMILVTYCCITVAIGLALLWYGNDTWLYSKIGDLDTWVYAGYGLHWADPAFMNWYYKASRLPWVLYEFVHYQLFGPIRAVPIVQTECYLLLFIGNYLFTRRLFDVTVAVLGSISFVLWTHIHANAGPDYHNTLCGPMFVWCACTILYINQERSPPQWFMIPGTLYLALVVTNPFYINLAPALIILALFTRQDPIWKMRRLIFSIFLRHSWRSTCIHTAWVGQRCFWPQLHFRRADVCNDETSRHSRGEHLVERMGMVDA
jgi:hypothetical protein